MWRALLKAAGRRAGLDISRYRPVAARRNALLSDFGIETVIDAGANVGQYGLELRSFGYRGRIISFEPLSAAYASLRDTASADPSWECHRIALGDAGATSQLGVASNLASSSLLPMLDAHRRAAPDIAIIESETVEVRTLDSFAIPVTGPTLLKLDVQGYEDRVLRGASSLLSAITLIECEVSVEPLYQSQLTLLPMLNLLRNCGFDLLRLEPGFRDCQGTGAALQFDAIAVRA